MRLRISFLNDLVLTSSVFTARITVIRTVSYLAMSFSNSKDLAITTVIATLDCDVFREVVRNHSEAINIITMLTPRVARGMVKEPKKANAV